MTNVIDDKRLKMK